MPDTSSNAIARDTAPAETPTAPRSTTVVYLLALLVIATISITSHFLTNSIVARQEGTAELVNTAGRQRMLSQRITRIAEGLADGTADPAAARAGLRSLADRMDKAQQQLISGKSANGLPTITSPDVDRIYYGAPVHLQQQVTDFLQHTRAFAASPTPTLASPDLRAMVRAADAPLLNGLDAAVAAYQAASEHEVRQLRHLMNSLTVLMLLVLVLEALLIYRPLFNRLTSAISLLTKASTTDFLTDALNRRAFMASCERELARAQRSGQPVCLLMADLDNFKTINDRYGHAVGDMVLKHFVGIAQLNLRVGDRLGRLGGEEFALLLPVTNMEGGILAAERIRERFSGTTAALSQRSERVHATVSFGVVCSTGGTVPEMMAQADKLLYRAKHSGRNRVEAAPFRPSAERDAIPGATHRPA